MIKKRLEFKFNILEKQDVIDAVSRIAGRKVELKEMDVLLGVSVPLCDLDETNFENCGLYCEIWVGGDEIFDEEYNGPLDEYLEDIPFFVTDDLIFAFSTDEFNSYERMTDTSD